MTAARYRKKPVETEAIQFTGDNVHEIWDAFGAAGIYGPTETNPDHLILTTVHGDQAPARYGDWIIPDGKPGTFYPCKPEVFAKTYDRVEPGPAATEALQAEETTRVFAALHRSAEQDVTRVIALYEQWVKAGPPPLGASTARWWDLRLAELHDALRPPTTQTTE